MTETLRAAYFTSHGSPDVIQYGELTWHKEILRRLHLPEPSRFHHFTPAATTPDTPSAPLRPRV